MAGEKDEYFTINAGFLFNSTLNATFGYERELTYGNAIELTGEVGNKWQRDPACGKNCKFIFYICTSKSVAKISSCVPFFLNIFHM